MGPVAPSQRIVELDILRGLALFGVLAVNIFLDFSGFRFRLPESGDMLARLSADSVAIVFLHTFVGGKAMALFSFLFGLGFAIQMQRAEAHRRPMGRLYGRRMAVLLVIGLIHAFLWYGDILARYALFGFILMAFYRRTDRTLIGWAAGLTLGIPLVFVLLMLVAILVMGELPAGDGSSGPDPVFLAFQSGEPARILRANLTMLRKIWLSPILVDHLRYLGLFVAGLLVGRRRLLEYPARHTVALRKLARWTLPLGIAGAGVSTAIHVEAAASGSAPGPWLGLLATTLDPLAMVLLAAGYLALTLLLVQRPVAGKLLGAFAPVGRMALTNYLAQTVVCLAIFIGGRWFGEVDPALSFGLACLIFGAQIVASRWWLDRFRFGPVEWVWRALTYGYRPPMRRESATG